MISHNNHIYAHELIQYIGTVYTYKYIHQNMYSRERFKLLNEYEYLSGIQILCDFWRTFPLYISNLYPVLSYRCLGLRSVTLWCA